MRVIGLRSSTEVRGHGRRVAFCLAVFLLLSALPAPGLDLFSLWRLEDVTLRIASGDRVVYRFLVTESGRTREDLTLVQCVGEDEDGWRLEVLPLREDAEGRQVVPGEGWALTLARTAAAQDGDLTDHVHGVVHWEAGVPHVVDEDHWREDPLLTSILDDDFRPRVREQVASASRVVGGRTLMCDRFVLARRDTSRMELPRGVLVQLHAREISVSLHADVPFLGVVQASERAETRSQVDPPGARRLPPPTIRVESMELLEFDRAARPHLSAIAAPARG